jgi:hypothetical protein
MTLCTVNDTMYCVLYSGEEAVAAVAVAAAALGGGADDPAASDVTVQTEGTERAVAAAAALPKTEQGPPQAPPTKREGETHVPSVLPPAAVQVGLVAYSG